MTRHALAALAAASLLASCVLLEQPAPDSTYGKLPNPAPPFSAVTTQVQPVELLVNAIPTSKGAQIQPSLRSGNKQVASRQWPSGFNVEHDQIFSVMVDGKIFGYCQVKGLGAASLAVDKAENNFSCDGQTASALADGKVKISWEGAPGRAFFYFDGRCRELGMSLNGEKLKPQTIKGGATLAVSPDKPAAGFTVSFGPEFELRLTDELGKYNDRWVMESVQPLAQGSFVIDLGPSAVAAPDAPPPVGGVDFWGRYRMNVPASPTRNLFPNPSFEQGLRYWTWKTGKYVPQPDKPPCYELSRDAKFGRFALKSNGTQGNAPLISFPVPVVCGKDYTLSFHAKADQPTTFTLLKNWKADKQWERHVLTFKPDNPFLQLTFNGPGVTIDGLQLEEGDKATAFAAPPVEARLLSSDPDNSLQPGKPFDTALELSGVPGLSGETKVTVSDFYREQLFAAQYPFALDKDGGVRIPLTLDSQTLGKGVFVMKVEFNVPGTPAYCDYYRLSVMDYLEKKRATARFFSNQCHAFYISRGDDLAKMYGRWGWGSISYGDYNPEETAFNAKHDITSAVHLVCGFHVVSHDHEVKKLTSIAFESDAISDADAKIVEETAYAVAKRNPTLTSWAFAGESECSSKLLRAGKFADFAKAQIATSRGVKRANPNAVVMPDSGTSGFSKLRGYQETEGYLAASQGKVKWDAIATHPYGYCDDLDESTVQLIELMAKYGYGKETPIYFVEAGNEDSTAIQEWGDNGCHDSYQAGRPSYDTSWREFLQASWDARLYLVALKYWPQVQQVNIWTHRPFMDVNFAPLMLCKAVNTLGSLFGNPKFVADIAPVEGVKGLAFSDENGRGLAALWSVGKDGDVERGLKPGPTLRADFGADTPEFIDLMGNVRAAKPVDGRYAIPLTPAPLFVRGPAGSAARLAAALNQAEVVGAGSTVRVNVLPDTNGKLVAELVNKTSLRQVGKLGRGNAELPFDLAPSGNGRIALDDIPTIPGKLQKWRETLQIKLANGSATESAQELAWFFVPHVAAPLPLDPAAPEWKTIPAIPVANWHLEPGAKGGQDGDLEAKFQMAWDKSNLYLRVECHDDHFVLSAPDKWRPAKASLYHNDGCVETYFDTGANGRGNLSKGYDQDDYRFDFYAGGREAVDGPGSVWRLVKVYHQLAGGVSMPSDEEAAKEVKCEFRRAGNNYAYVMVFPQRQIEPLALRPGFTAGFGLYVHDKEPGEKDPLKGLSLATEPGAHCYCRPDLWPLMILGD